MLPELFPVEPGSRMGEVMDAFEVLLRAAGKRWAQGQGLVEAKAEGKLEGRSEGKAELLLRQLARRLGPLPADLVPGLRALSHQELDVMAERVLEAHTLEEVLGDH
jgi:hypothetical protein